MKHLLKKISLKGAGGKKPKVKPATLKPPIIGSHKIAASYDYLECLDLVSDGPIEGLCNQNGTTLKGRSILQGVYLDNVPVIVTNDLTVPPLESNVSLNYDTFNSFDLPSSYGSVVSEFFANILSKPNRGPHGALNIDFTKWRCLSYFYDNNFYSQYKPITDNNNKIIKKIKNDNLMVMNMADSFTNFSLPININLVNDIFKNYKKGFGYASSNKLPHGIRDYIYKWINTPWGSNTTKLASVAINAGAGGLRDIIALANGQNSPSKWTQQYAKNLLNGKLGGDDSWTKLNDIDKVHLLIKSLNINGENDAVLILPIPPAKQDLTGSVKKYLLTSDGLNLKPCSSALFNASNSVHINNIYNDGIYFHDFLVPTIDDKGYATGEFSGFTIIHFKGSHTTTTTSEEKTESSGRFKVTYKMYYYQDAFVIKESAAKWLLDLDTIKFLTNEQLTQQQEQAVSSVAQDKYNYSDIFMEYREGLEYQVPFKYFNKIPVDKTYSAKLIGPFKLNGQIQRIVPDYSMFDAVNYNKTLESSNLEKSEGSNDSSRQTGFDYSSWNPLDYNFQELAMPITHIIMNRNVEQAYITLQVDELFDTLEKDTKTGVQNDDVSAGTNYPSILVIEVEVGLIDTFGKKTKTYAKRFQIVSLIQSPTHIDIGNYDSFEDIANYGFIKNITTLEDIATPFNLPPSDDLGLVKRYISVSKISTESNTALIRKEVSLYKITEIIDANLTYPFSAIVGTKLDARSFTQAPVKTFDCKLKKVKVPNNYFPCDPATGKDKRYYSTIDISSFDTQIYYGDWNGEFYNDLVWTDNPAWILYDILTNNRYGLGQYLDITQIDKWELYKIGRFCDAVDEKGYFIGVSDANGGLEPRFSCNVLLQQDMKIFDAINVIASLFRGLCYYYNSQVHFVDDRPKAPKALFSNSNVKDGIFNYSNFARDQQYNAVEVKYIDRFEDFKTKIEYVEDEEDIRKRGIFKKSVDGLGISSKSLARRMGKHIIFQTIKENQSVVFTAGLEALLCRPGDLVIIEDKLKSLKSNFGRVLDVNQSEGSIRLDEQFVSGDFNGLLTVYLPTGYKTTSELNDITSLYRNKLDGFYLNQAGWDSQYNYLTGDYSFYKYTDGFSGEIYPSILKEQYAFYTGSNSKFCYFSTQFTGWVLGTGTPFTNNNSYNKFISSTDDYNFYEINSGVMYPYDSSSTSGRDSVFNTALNSITTGSAAKFRDVNNQELIKVYGGLTSSDIDLYGPSQINNFTITGFSQDYSKSGYGCKVFVSNADINYSLIKFIPLGSTYRFQRNYADDQYYKIYSIQEDNPNEYKVTASLFNTGKYSYIEENIDINYQYSTFPHTTAQMINDKTFATLPMPQFATGTGVNGLATGLTTGLGSDGSLYLSGAWEPGVINQCDGYNVLLKQSNGYTQEIILRQNQTVVEFAIEGIGNYQLSVQAIGKIDANNKYFNSQYNSTGIFLLYSGASFISDRGYLNNVSIQ